MNEFLFGYDGTNKLQASLVQSIIIQLICVPLNIYYFGYVSILGILANILLSSTVSVIMLLGVLSAIDILKTIAVALSGIHIKVIEVIAEQSWGIFEYKSDSSVLVIYVAEVIVVAIIYLAVLRDRAQGGRLEKSQKYGKIYLC